MITNEKKDDNKIIIIENPEVINGENYFGKIALVHPNYVFINSIKRGYETIATNGDVFCPILEGLNFEVGQTVQFSELNPDRDKAGRFRTEKIFLVQNSIDLSTEEGRISAVVKFSKLKSPYHQNRKIISEEDKNKAAKNKPLLDFVQQIGYLLNNNSGYNPEDVVRLTEDFVARTFSMLTPLGVTCSIVGDIDKDTEQQMIQENIALYNESGLGGQAESLQKEYEQFKKVRDVFNLMHENNLLSYSSVIDVKHLPELTTAFPVLFINGKEGLHDLSAESDPSPDHAIKFLADCVGSQEYSWFYQLYNRRTRPLSRFSGKDIIPPSLVKIMNKAKATFDYVAIMTPYHDVASKEWSDPNWLRNIDPLMVGFLKGLPYMFILGRWSGTGVFPLLLDCIADTMNHLKINKHLLKNFKNDSYWYRGKKNGGTILSNSDDNGLENYANKLLLAYDNGFVFEFLRGDLHNNPDYSF
ncbi:MAG: hypothetical protein WCX46_00550 [Candidatus Paceibacterota bacterium]